MQILFLHNNFPAQFGSLGLYLKNEGWDVWFGTQRKNSELPGLRVFNYEPHRAVSEKIHPYVANFENAAINGQGMARAALGLRKSGLNPDIVVAHSGWGPGLFAKDVWPNARYVGYFEWYYQRNAPDVEYFGREKRELDDDLRGRARNAAILTDLASCDVGICPTHFQNNQFPDCFREKMKVIHDGIDTDVYKPNPNARLVLDDADLSGVDEIITYVARGMEPYRGFPQFMAALEDILKRRPNAHAVIVGEDRVAYGKKLPAGESFKTRALKAHSFDMDRVHFTGLVPRNKYREIIQASTVHIYLTIPFVLSWSMMESMSAGCALVASNYEPVRELITHGESGHLVNMKDKSAIVQAVEMLLENSELREQYGAAARDRIVANYAAKDIYPAKKEMFEALCA
ncbi:MAG: glycosyltransferase [Pseudomonadota bacterium]